ncbi:RNA polymerase sigma factor [Liquorilactobacillus sicerae]|uniref:RNA polymerase sigma factor n=1 Tax=Liquorilactobacillus sicerae TaxID=1416943 RepID=UPI0024810F73|nr:sigma-70 family RNA polymerase sigma factor [Liquorilactobacillus sicerae]
MKDRFEKSNISDSSLVLKIREENDSDALELLFSKYLPVVNKALGRYHLHFVERADLIQEARIVCYQTTLLYQIGSKASFGAYFQKSLLNRYCSLLRRESALKRRAEINAASFEELNSDGQLCFKTVANYNNNPLFAIVLFKEVLRNLPNVLSKSEYQVFVLLYIDRANVVEISRTLNKSAQQVSRLISSCRKKIRDELSTDD